MITIEKNKTVLKKILVVSSGLSIGSGDLAIGSILAVTGAASAGILLPGHFVHNQYRRVNHE